MLGYVVYTDHHFMLDCEVYIGPLQNFLTPILDHFTTHLFLIKSLANQLLFNLCSLLFLDNLNLQHLNFYYLELDLQASLFEILNLLVVKPLASDFLRLFSFCPWNSIITIKERQVWYLFSHQNQQDLLQQNFLVNQYALNYFLPLIFNYTGPPYYLFFNQYYQPLFIIHHNLFLPYYFVTERFKNKFEYVPQTLHNPLLHRNLNFFCFN